MDHDAEPQCYIPQHFIEDYCREFDTRRKPKALSVVKQKVTVSRNLRTQHPFLSSSICPTSSNRTTRAASVAWMRNFERILTQLRMVYTRCKEVYHFLGTFARQSIVVLSSFCHVHGAHRGPYYIPLRVQVYASIRFRSVAYGTFRRLPHKGAPRDFYIAVVTARIVIGYLRSLIRSIITSLEKAGSYL